MRRPEQSIQKAVFAHLIPDVIAIKRVNVAELLCESIGLAYALELKAGRGKPTDDQCMAMHALEQAGATVAVATGLDAALSQLEQWGLLR